MPDLDLIKQAEQGVRDPRGGFARGRSGNAADLAGAVAAVADAAAEGAVTPHEAMQLGHVVEAYVRPVEATEFERRLRVLEAADVASA